MPILERDPWRLQFFAHVKCPENVMIPTDDLDCWNLFPAHRWVYEKVLVAQSQRLACGLHGALPDSYPVFSKPNINLKGMGTGSVVIGHAEDMVKHNQPGHMWMQLLRGPHISTDCVVIDGDVRWMRHAVGTSGVGGTFKYWTIEAADNPTLEAMIALWVKRHMSGYCGMMNFETIDGRIIETHLRFADQWCDLYGLGWVEALVRLYSEQVWQFNDASRQVGYSVPLFAHHGGSFFHPAPEVQARIRSLPQVKSLQITFHEEKANETQPMPPGGFRLAIVNTTDLQAGFAARNELALAFPVAKFLD